METKNEYLWEVASGIQVALDELERQARKTSGKDARTISKIQALLETARQMAADAASK